MIFSLVYNVIFIILIWKCNIILHTLKFSCATASGYNFLTCRKVHFVITARKRSLQRLCFYRCLSVQGGLCLWSLCLGGLCPGGLYWGVSVQGSLSGESVSRWVSVQGGVCLGCLCQGDPSPASTVTCGRYASYWNAFLFICKTCKSATVSQKYIPQTVLFPIVINKSSLKIKVSTTIAIFNAWNTIVGINLQLQEWALKFYKPQ